MSASVLSDLRPASGAELVGMEEPADHSRQAPFGMEEELGRTLIKAKKICCSGIQPPDNELDQCRIAGPS